MQNTGVKICLESSQSRVYNFILEEEVGEAAEWQAGLSGLYLKSRYELRPEGNNRRDTHQIHQCPIEQTPLLRSQLTIQTPSNLHREVVHELQRVSSWVLQKINR